MTCKWLVTAIVTTTTTTNTAVLYMTIGNGKVSRLGKPGDTTLSSATILRCFLLRSLSRLSRSSSADQRRLAKSQPTRDKTITNMITTNRGLSKSIRNHVSSRAPYHPTEPTVSEVLSEALQMKVYVGLSIPFVF